ncbi:hypothetical protein RCKVOTHE_35 [Rhodobacter phage RcKvothe]|nr:hypothetical protein RCKVOTHE_35 [Rhodobacter phage RcKvothe]
MPHISQKELAELREIARTATMKTACFCFPNEVVLAARETFGPFENLTVDELIKARTKVWRDSWIVDPLEDLIARLEAKPEGKGPHK